VCTMLFASKNSFIHSSCMLFFGGAGLGGVEATFAARLEIGTDLVGARQSQNQHIFLDWTSRREPLERNLKNKNPWIAYLRASCYGPAGIFVQARGES
jgi:hypothetical protein